MNDATLIDELLVLVALTLFILEIYALRMVRVLRRKIGTGPGAYLTRVVFRFGLFVVIAQALTAVNAILRWSSVNDTADLRLFLFLVIETMLAVSFLWTVWEIHRLPSDFDPRRSTRDRPQRPERIGEHVDYPVTPTSAPVDQDD